MRFWKKILNFVHQVWIKIHFTVMDNCVIAIMLLVINKVEWLTTVLFICIFTSLLLFV